MNFLLKFHHYIGFFFDYFFNCGDDIYFMEKKIF